MLIGIFSLIVTTKIFNEIWLFVSLLKNKLINLTQIKHGGHYFFYKKFQDIPGQFCDYSRTFQENLRIPCKKKKYIP